ncbi:hypothetical protein OSTOST_08525 [Ostertagia ostertagi]
MVREKADFTRLFSLLLPISIAGHTPICFRRTMFRIALLLLLVICAVYVNGSEFGWGFVRPRWYFGGRLNNGLGRVDARETRSYDSYGPGAQ